MLAFSCERGHFGRFEKKKIRNLMKLGMPWSKETN